MATRYQWQPNPTGTVRQLQQDEACPQLPGTILRIFLPAGTVINLLNLLEIASPSGVCLIVRIPVLNGNSVMDTVTNAVRAAGGTIEVVPAAS